MFDFVIVGSGLYGATFAHQANKAGYRCLVVEKRNHLAGNCHTPLVDGIRVHQYGAHIFHTSYQEVWDFVNRFACFNNFRNAPIANYRGQIYNLPFNMNTFNRIFGVITPEEAKAKLEKERQAVFTPNPQNLEEQAKNLVGAEIYEKLVRHYTQKQWGRPCDQLPAFIIRRLPLRFTYDNNYFDDPYQGIPKEGYTQLVTRLLSGIRVQMTTDYLENRSHFDQQARCLVYTGAVDGYFDYRFGTLKYRSLRFETETLQTDNYQGNAVVNYTDPDTPYTRMIEHKHFAPVDVPHTIVSREYSQDWLPGREAYYPINDQQNNELYKHYQALAQTHPKVFFGGRLGRYQYLNMDQVIHQALQDSRPEQLAGLLRQADLV